MNTHIELWQVNGRWFARASRGDVSCVAAADSAAVGTSLERLSATQNASAFFTSSNWYEWVGESIRRSARDAGFEVEQTIRRRAD
jgi:hypothetical protein